MDVKKKVSCVPRKAWPAQTKKKKTPKPDIASLRRQHADFCHIMGYELMKEKKSSKLASILKQAFCYLIITVNMSLLVVQSLYEHKSGGHLLVNLVQIGIMAFGAIAFVLNGLSFYQNQANLIKSLDYCEQLYTNYEGKPWAEREQLSLYRKTSKIATTLYQCSTVIPMAAVVLSFFMTLITGRRTLPVQLYENKGMIERWPWFHIIFINQTVDVYWYFRFIIFNLTTFIIFVKHCSAQFRVLACAMRDIDNDPTDEDKSKSLQTVQRLHSGLLEQINTLDSIFRFSLLTNKIVCVIAFTLAGAISLYNRSAVPCFIMAVFNGLFCSIFPYFAQEIIDAADDFFLATYECNWLKFSVKDRKTLVLVMLMAGKPVGLSTGGFNLSSYQELTDVRE